MGNMVIFAGLLLSALGAVAQTTFPVQTYVTENFKAPSLQINRTGTTEPGYLFYGIVGHGYVPQSPIIMSDNGDLVWYGGRRISSHNVRVQTYNKKPVLSYWTGFGDNFGHGYGSIDIFDTQYNLINSVCLQTYIVTPRPEKYPGTRNDPCFFDSHESFITDRGTVIGTAFNVTQTDLTAFGGNKNGWVFDALFFEVDIATGEIVFQWSALENVPLSESNYHGTNMSEPLKIGRQVYGLTQDNPWDFFHINSVQPVPGGYLVNSRMTWSMYKVDGTTGKVDWTLEGSQGGDFELGPGIFWSWQHMPRLNARNGHIWRISLFNNDNINAIVYGTNQSTGYLLEVDLKKKTATALKDLSDDVDEVFSAAEGAYQKLANGHVLLGYGSKAIIKEFDRAGDVVYAAQFAPLTNSNPDQDGGKDVHSYRAYRYDWSAQPAYPPKAAALLTDQSITVYMSWNGATTYDAWNIYAGTSQNNLQKVVANVPANGFETSNNMGLGSGAVFKYFQVEALGRGKRLGKSEVFAVQDSSKV